MIKKQKEVKPKEASKKDLKKKIYELELALEGCEERYKKQEENLQQRIKIDEYISTNKQQTMFAQLRAVEARLHLAYTIMDLQKKRSFTSEKNAIYAQEYLDLIRSKVLV